MDPQLKNTPLKPLISITPYKSNSFTSVISGISNELESELEVIQKDLHLAKKRIFGGKDTENEYKVVEKLKNNLKRMTEQIVYFQNENVFLKKEVKQKKKENAKLLKDIDKKNKEIGELHSKRLEDLRSSHEARSTSAELKKYKSENENLRITVKEKQDKLDYFEKRLNHQESEMMEKGSSYGQKLELFLNGVKDATTKFQINETSVRKDVTKLREKVTTLTENQKESTKKFQSQLRDFERKRKEDERRIEAMKIEYRNNFVQLKSDFESNLEKMKMEYGDDLNIYKNELEKKDEEIKKLTQMLKNS